jgi:5-methylcytosine-specific restriction endonuclease McrA
MAITEAVKVRVRERAYNRCGYCLTQQQYVPWSLEIEHIIPKAKGGSDNEDNIWLACRSCNLYKADQTEAIDNETRQLVPLFNPIQQEWMDHFSWSNDGLRIVGKSAIGRATIAALQLNNIYALTVRRHWIEAGWHPPTK